MSLLADSAFRHAESAALGVHSSRVMQENKDFGPVSLPLLLICTIS